MSRVARLSAAVEWTIEATAALATEISGVSPLSGGCIGEVYAVRLADGRTIVAKVSRDGNAKLPIEAHMLRYLAEQSSLPVPHVLYDSPSLLLMDHISGDSRFSEEAQQSAAELLAALHGQAAMAFGFEQDTLIGGLHQPNPWTGSWVDFFAEQRLRYMAHEAARSGRLPQPLLRRVESLAGNLGTWIEKPPQPALIHGDVWTTNVLADPNQVTAFLDPAIYYAHPEVELAFITLFGTFGDPFFVRYASLRPIEPGFFEERRHLYNLYPLLVHVRLFGGGYVASVASILQQFGH